MSTLCPADEQNLLSSGLVSSVSPQGTRKIHRRRLNLFSDEENAHIPLTSLSDTPSDSIEAAFHTIPDQLISKATLKCLGYNTETANELWFRWTHWPPNTGVIRETDPDGAGCLEMPFIIFATGHLASGREVDTCDDEDDEPWYNCMLRCGINSSTQQDIMVQDFRVMRLTESCRFWLKDTMILRYRGLEEVQNASQQRSLSGVSTSMGPDMSSASDLPVPGCITLYRGTDRTSLDHLFHDSGAVKNLGVLISHSSTDFRSMESAFCFVADQDIAESHAQWVKHRHNASSVVIV